MGPPNARAGAEARKHQPEAATGAALRKQMRMNRKCRQAGGEAHDDCEKHNPWDEMGGSLIGHGGADHLWKRKGYPSWINNRMSASLKLNAWPLGFPAPWHGRHLP
jgi:hypothetical protein